MDVECSIRFSQFPSSASHRIIGLISLTLIQVKMWPKIEDVFVDIFLMYSMFCVVTWDVGDACKNKDDSCRSWRISKRFKDSQASLSSDPIFSMAENLEELWFLCKRIRDPIFCLCVLVQAHPREAVAQCRNLKRGQLGLHQLHLDLHCLQHGFEFGEVGAAARRH